MRWFEPALQRIKSLPCESDSTLRSFLDFAQPLLVARAPGRLDVMGGIADYSGADVLELPLAESTWAVLQPRTGSRAELLTPRENRWDAFALEIGTLQGSASEVAGRFTATDRWAAYPLGVLQRCLQLGAPVDRGFRLLLASTVPEGKGVASSAALEVATLSVLASHYGLELEPDQLALECQWAENDFVGAPCGVMDQMTAVLGKQDRLLALRCQPHGQASHVAIPEGYRCYGIDSGVRHAVSGADYGTVRTAAFMGYRMLAAEAGLGVRGGNGTVRVDDPRWGGFLCSLLPKELERLGGKLPDQIRGDDFLTRYHGITDRVTRVDPSRSYPVRAATRHPVLEQRRVTQFAQLLRGLARDPRVAIELGALMRESHQSYSACGLGSEATDRLVELVAEAGPEHGLFGAKITGGGSGGTVAIFGRADAEPAVRMLARRYATESGRGGQVFAESGPGTLETGILVVAPGDLE